MSGNKKPRKKISLVRNKTKHIDAVINRCLAKFHVIGDMNRIPTAFHYGDIKMHLKGVDLKLALEYVNEFLFDLKQPWTLMGYYYFKNLDGVVSVPAVIEREDTTYLEMGDVAESLIKDMAREICNFDSNLKREDLLFYGYYLTYGKDLNIESVENQLHEIFLKITNSLENIVPNVVIINREKLINALNNDKFHLVNSNALSTSFKQID